LTFVVVVTNARKMWNSVQMMEIN